MGREAGKLVDLVHEGVDILFCCLLFSQGKILEDISQERGDRKRCQRIEERGGIKLGKFRRVDG